MTARKPVLLDLFAGAGGAAVGYAWAGFRVVGVDSVWHRDYPFRLIVADVRTVLDWDLSRFDVIHASPPCQRWAAQTPDPSRHPDLITPVRKTLRRWRVPYVIENVPRAPLVRPVKLCGTAFGLRLWRHRLFESNVPLHGKACRHDGRRPIGVYGMHPETKRYRRLVDGTERGVRARSLEQAQRALGIDWMTDYADLADAVPPAYTEWIGAQVMRAYRDGR